MTVKLTAAQKLKIRGAVSRLPVVTDNYGTKGTDKKGRPSISRALHGRHNKGELSQDTIARFLRKHHVDPKDVNEVSYRAWYSFTSTHSPVQNTKRLVHTLDRLLGLNLAAE